jgi:hypothetical protein
MTSGVLRGATFVAPILELPLELVEPRVLFPKHKEFVDVEEAHDEVRARHQRQVHPVEGARTVAYLVV